jgi:hypothetical protein
MTQRPAAAGKRWIPLPPRQRSSVTRSDGPHGVDLFTGGYADQITAAFDLHLTNTLPR